MAFIYLNTIPKLLRITTGAKVYARKLSLIVLSENDNILSKWVRRSRIRLVVVTPPSLTTGSRGVYNCVHSR